MRAREHCRIAAGLALLVVVQAARASGADGVVEINQARAKAGGVTPGDPPGFPVLLSAPGSYVLTGDLDLRGEASPADATAIQITADSVWLDLNGFSIVGPFTCSGAPPIGTGSGDGIASPASHVVVTGGQVRGVGRDGIALGPGTRVRDVLVSCCGRYGVATGPRSLVTGSQVDSCGDFGLKLGSGSAFGGSVLVGNDGGGGGLQVSGGTGIVEVQGNSCAGSVTCDLCGDGACSGGEDCASCAVDCGPCATCGNLTIEPPEECDDGGDSPTCDADCTLATCGDAYANPVAGEQCDTGGDSATCDGDCTAPLCGDGHVNPVAGEQCDTVGDSATCDADCTAPVCGDGYVNPVAGEECDTVGDSAICDGDCTAPVCGDGYTNLFAGETCDGGGVDTPSCDVDCTVVQCGDGHANLTAGEQCDDGNADNFDTCTNVCEVATCGDGFCQPAIGEDSATCLIDCP